MADHEKAKPLRKNAYSFTWSLFETLIGSHTNTAQERVVRASASLCNQGHHKVKIVYSPFDRGHWSNWPTMWMTNAIHQRT